MTQKHKIQLFEDKKVRTAWDDEKQEWFFSVTDIVQVLTDRIFDWFLKQPSYRKFIQFSTVKSAADRVEGE